MIRFDERNQRWRWEFDRLLRPDASAPAQRIRKSRLLPQGITEEQARALDAKMEADEYVKHRLVSRTEGWDAYVDGLVDDKRSWLHMTLRGCKGRAVTKDRTCTITLDDLVRLMKRSRGRCEVTGIAFQIHKPEQARARPFFHSLDRIDSSRGYFPSNCRIVCYAVNLAMSNWGEDVFGQIATGYVVNRYCVLGLSAAASADK